MFRDLIFDKLSPLVGKKCVLPDLPYYPNVGDLLIWEGMEQFLKDNRTKCLWRSSISTFEYRELSEDIAICLVGGGNFGDLWRGLQEFKNNIIQLYPKNRIIIFPQSVHYNDLCLCEHDAKIFTSHDDIHICARDNVSYNFLKDHFPTCNIILVPDMALYLQFDSQKLDNDRVLLLKRVDKEASDYSNINSFDMDVADWPTIDKPIVQKRLLKDRLRHVFLRWNAQLGQSMFVFRIIEANLIKIMKSYIKVENKWDIAKTEFDYLIYLNKYRFPGKLNKVIDWFVLKFYKPIAIQLCKEFLNNYGTIYSTRLHGWILGNLLGKKVYLIDDKNKKLSSFHETWYG